MKRAWRAGLLIASVSLAAGCRHMPPPPPLPGPAEPPQVSAPLRPGQGRLYLEVVDGPTDVRAVKWVAEQVTVGGQVIDDDVLETEEHCRTPCVLDLQLGQQQLAFPVRGSVQVEVDEVRVTPTPSVYRRALGWRQSSAAWVLGILGTSFGGCVLATGAALLPVGLATNQSGLTTSGLITLGAGAALTALGIWSMAANPALVQPGAGAQYDLASPSEPGSSFAGQPPK